MNSDLAVFTVIYPAAMRYVPELLAGLAEQSDDQFTLVVALDLVEPSHFASLARHIALPDIEVHVVGGTPVEIRNEVLLDLCQRFSLLLLQDADDVPRPERVATQRVGLREADVIGSALALVDENGRSLHRTLRPPSRPIDTFLPRMNVFGFGNSAYHSEVLVDCLPVPRSLQAMDWFVATRAHLAGAVLKTSDVVIADYRQHGASAAPVLPPLTVDDLELGMAVSRTHLSSIGSVATAGASSWVAPRLAELQRFERWLRKDERNGSYYLDTLNRQHDRVFAWWEYVASESMEYLWTP